MDNPEKLATLGTQNTGRRQTKHINVTHKTKEIRDTYTTNNWGCIKAFAKGR